MISMLKTMIYWFMLCVCALCFVFGVCALWLVFVFCALHLVFMSVVCGSYLFVRCCSNQVTKKYWMWNKLVWNCMVKEDLLFFWLVWPLLCANIVGYFMPFLMLFVLLYLWRIMSHNDGWCGLGDGLVAMCMVEGILVQFWWFHFPKWLGRISQLVLPRGGYKCRKVGVSATRNYFFFSTDKYVSPNILKFLSDMHIVTFYPYYEFQKIWWNRFDCIKKTKKFLVALSAVSFWNLSIAGLDTKPHSEYVTPISKKLVKQICLLERGYY